jgi:hypothetical protein
MILHFSAMFLIYLAVSLFFSLAVSAKVIKLAKLDSICSQEVLKKSGRVLLKKLENHSCPLSKAL